MSERKVEAQLYQDAFVNVLALYSMLREQPSRSVRRAELKQGEVTAEPIDFLADVELKAKRTLGLLYFRRLMQLINLGRYQEFPVDLQSELGQAFLENNMDCSGHYRILYYRAKNNQLLDRDEPTQFPEEPVQAEDLLT